MAELNNNVSTQEAAVVAESTPKTYSLEEVDALLQQETDRRVTSALKKQEAKNAEKVREALKLANMDAQQKYEYELNQREAAIAAKEKALALSENKNVASQILNSKGLSLDLVNFVVAEDAETMDANIKSLERAFKASVKAEVEKRLGSNAPKQAASEDNYTNKKVSQLSIRELQEIKNSNPELYTQILNNK